MLRPALRVGAAEVAIGVRLPVVAPFVGLASVRLRGTGAPRSESTVLMLTAAVGHGCGYHRGGSSRLPPSVRGSGQAGRPSGACPATTGPPSTRLGDSISIDEYA